MTITIIVRTLATPGTPSSIITTIGMEDLLEESFHLHRSLCDDEYFHFGGCVASSIKFTTTKLKYDNNGTPTPIDWKNVALEVHRGTASGYCEGIFFPQEYIERVNHTRVEITAYDAMYKLNNYDVSAWYAQLCRDYPEGTSVLSVLNSALAYALPQLPCDYKPQQSIEIDTGVSSTSILWWRPYAIVTNPSTGVGERTPILSGTIKMGTILKGICQVLGYNAVYETTFVSSDNRDYAKLHLINVLNTATLTPPEVYPTDYAEFDYSSLDPIPFSDVRFGAYGDVYNASPNDIKVYGVTGNWCANAVSQFEEEDAHGDLKNDLKIHAEALLDAFVAAYQFSQDRPFRVVAFGDIATLGKRVRIYDTNNNLYNGKIMQTDIDGLVGATFTHVCLPTEDYFVEQDFGAYNANNERLTELSGKVSRDELATVATTGNYEDLTNKPSIPAAQVNADWNADSGVAKILNKPSLATVATSGSYNDLSNKPTSLPASDVYAWAKAATKPSYSYSEITGTPTIPTSANYLARGAWWYQSSVLNIDDLRDGIHFVYTSHGAPVIGTLITFSGLGTDSSPNYCWQMLTQYNGTTVNVYVRKRNGDNGTWSSWARLARADEIPTALSQLTNDITYINTRGAYVFDASTAPKTHPFGISTGFVSNTSGFGNYGSVLTVRSYENGGGTLQLYAPYSPTYGGTRLKARFGNYDSGGGNTWTALKDIAWLEDVTDPKLLREVDTRNDNQTPAWYMSTYANSSAHGALVSEFKYANKIGVSSSASFGTLYTSIPWGNNSGTRPVQFFVSTAYGFYLRYATSDTAWGAWQDIMSATWSGGQISNSGIAYANANNEIGWVAGFGSQGYLKLTGGKTSGKTGLLDVVADTWVLEGANNTSGYNKWLYHGKLASNRFQCGTLAFSAAGSNSVTFSGAFGGVPIVSLTVQGNSNVYVRTYSLSASAMYITVSGACTVHWMAYYNA